MDSNGGARRGVQYVQCVEADVRSATVNRRLPVLALIVAAPGCLSASHPARPHLVPQSDTPAVGFPASCTALWVPSSAAPADALAAYEGREFWSPRGRPPARRISGFHASVQYFFVANGGLDVPTVELGPGRGAAILLAEEPEGLELWIGRVNHDVVFPAGDATTDFVRIGGRAVLGESGPVRLVLAAGVGVDTLYSDVFPTYAVAISFDLGTGEVLPVSGYLRVGAVGAFGRFEVYGDVSASLGLMLDRENDEAGNYFLWTVALGAGWVF
jgi:hypothetical protein